MARALRSSGAAQGFPKALDGPRREAHGSPRPMPLESQGRPPRNPRDPPREPHGEPRKKINQRE